MTASQFGYDLTNIENRLTRLERLVSAVDRLEAIQDALSTTDTRALALAIVDSACDTFSGATRVTRSQVLAPGRITHVVFVRHVAMSILYRDIGLPSTDVGKLFNRDHTSVLYAVKAVQDRCDTDPAFAAKLQTLRERVKKI